MPKTRYAFAGASARALGMYAIPLVNDFKETAEVVGVFDVNQTRMDSSCGAPTESLHRQRWS